MKDWTDRMHAITAAIESGSIERSARVELVQFNAWLCHPNAGMHFAKNYDQVCETVRLHLLRTFMDELERKNSQTQKLVIALTIAALLSATVQTVVTVMAYVKPPTIELKFPTIAPVPKAPAAQSAIPTPAQPPSARPTHISPPAKQPKHVPAKP